MNRIKKLAIIGYGARGHIYGDFALKNPDMFQVVAVADTDEGKRDAAQKLLGCPVFNDVDGFIASGIKADVAAVAVQDCDHLSVARKLMRLKFDILLEKPIATTLADCLELEREAKANDVKVVVCHVLRYTPFYSLVKKTIDSGVLGDIVTVHASESVGYWHQAHSFVRGPWRNSAESAPMILAKCCHDMDLLRWLIGKKPLKISSFGSLSHFNAENAPLGSAEYCSECKVKDCPYRAENFYLKNTWWAGYFTDAEKTEENIRAALEKSQYGRCVYRCDNDVVDHEVTAIEFEDGVTACHTMTAFSKNCYRDIKIHGTAGELVGVFEEGKFEVRPFIGDTYTVETNVEGVCGNHGGGDVMMMRELYDILVGENCRNASFIDVSMDSHKMAFGAEESRLTGKVVEL